MRATRSETLAINGIRKIAHDYLCPRINVYSCTVCIPVRLSEPKRSLKIVWAREGGKERGIECSLTAGCCVLTRPGTPTCTHTHISSIYMSVRGNMNPIFDKLIRNLSWVTTHLVLTVLTFGMWVPSMRNGLFVQRPSRRVLGFVFRCVCSARSIDRGVYCCSAVLPIGAQGCLYSKSPGYCSQA